VVGLSVVLTFVLTAAFALMESTFTLFAEHIHGLGPQQLGRMFGLAGLTMLILQGGLIGPLVRRFGEGKLIPYGVSTLAIGLVLLPLVPPGWALIAVFILIAIGQGLASPSLQSLISKSTPAEQQGFVLGTNQSMSALARVIGPAAGGLLYTGLDPASPFLAAAAILLGGLLLSVAAVRQNARARAA
jgi:MFS family permease